MAQSLASIMIHLVFSTKDRVAWITPAIEASLHANMAQILKDLECPALKIGGMHDHIHILFALNRTKSVSQVVEDVKKKSSRWVKTEYPDLQGFQWQSGYGAFSVGQSGLEKTRDYIISQKEHHQLRSFQDEFQSFLKKYDITWDEKYLWD